MEKKLTEIPKPIYSDFVIENGKGFDMINGRCYYYVEVIRLLKEWDRRKESAELSNCNKPQVSISKLNDFVEFAKKSWDPKGSQTIEHYLDEYKKSFNVAVVCPKCGNTGRCEPRALSDPDGQECDCGAN